jgi:quinolinate synthase
MAEKKVVQSTSSELKSTRGSCQVHENLNPEIVHKFQELSLNVAAQMPPAKSQEARADDVSVNELASYLETLLNLPQPMSYMASLMYN